MGDFSTLFLVACFALLICLFVVSSIYEQRRREAWLAEKRAIAEGHRPLSPEGFFELRNSYKGHMQDFDFMGCYVIHNLTNGMYYVGQATHVPQRVNAHFTGKGNGDVYADYRYGNQFEIYMVDITTTNYRRLDDLERDLIVAALVILGPPIARYGLELVDSAIEYRDSMNTRLDAQQSGNAHYVATSHEAGTIDYKRSDLFISGEYFIAIKSDAHYGILSIACGAYDADAPDKTDKYHTVPDYFDERGGIGMSVVDGSRDGWTIRDDELRSVLEAHGLSYDTFCSNTAAFNLGEDELADLTSQVASVITYGDIASYPVDDDTSFTYTLDGHAYQDDADMDEWVVFAGGVVGASYPDSFALNGSNDNPQMFADAQPTSSVE